MDGYNIIILYIQYAIKEIEAFVKALTKLESDLHGKWNIVRSYDCDI